MKSTRTPSSSSDRILMRVLWVLIAITLFLCWVLTVNPNAVLNGPQFLPWLMGIILKGIH